MKRNIIVLLISTALYWLAFQGGAQLIILYVVVNLNTPVLPIILIEQSTIPFIFGYLTSKYLITKNKLAPSLVLVMPIFLVSMSLLFDRNENGEFAFQPLSLFFTIISLQFIFILGGSYLKYSRNS